MPISIWQQWASNHSGSFTLVGMFPTCKEARQVADRLLNLFQDIADWYRLPENRTAQKTVWLDDSPPTPVEIAFARELGIDWGQFGPEWLPEPEFVSNIMCVEENKIVFQVGSTHEGPEPMDRVLSALGARIDVEMVVNAPIRARLELTCSTPSEAVAERVVHSAMRFIDGQSAPPWSKYGWDLFDRGQIHVSQNGIRLAVHDTRTGEYGIRELVNFLSMLGCQDIDLTVDWS